MEMASNLSTGPRSCLCAMYIRRSFGTEVPQDDSGGRLFVASVSSGAGCLLRNSLPADDTGTHKHENQSFPLQSCRSGNRMPGRDRARQSRKEAAATKDKPQVSIETSDAAVKDAAADVIAGGEVTGKAFETTLLHRPAKLKAKRLLLLGGGKAKDFFCVRLAPPGRRCRAHAQSRRACAASPSSPRKPG